MRLFKREDRESDRKYRERDIKEMIAEGKDIEVKCHFCNTAYTFTVEELEKLLHHAKKN